MLEDILASQSALSIADITYKDFLVARRGSEIVACARLFKNPGNIPEIKSVWVKDRERGHRLGQLLVRLLLSLLHAR